MQFKSFKEFVGSVFQEGRRMQKHDINGKSITKKRFTQTQKLSAVISAALVYLIPKGFSEDFAGYTISFLGIFIGLFTSIVINLYDKGQTLISESSEVTHDAKVRQIQVLNYIKQFNGLTAYSILKAIILIVLLMGSMLISDFETDLSSLRIADQTGWEEIKLAIHAVFLVAHRFIVFYLLLTFFTITLFAVSSYFAYLAGEFKKNQGI